jgi:hypothetical protein
MGKDIEVYSDGNRKDWEKGVKLACKVLKKKIANPIEKEEV